MTEDVTLKVGELTERGDFGRGIVRISARDMRKININEGDVIEIEGKRKTVGIAVRAYPVDIGLDIIRMDGLARRNAGTGIGDVVAVRAAQVKEAKAVTIAPARKGIIIHMANNLLKQNLLMRPLMTGDIIIPNPIVQPDRRAQNTLFEQFFGMDIGDFLFTPFGDEKFIVVNTDPKGPVRITRETEVELLPQAAKPLEEGKIPEVTYEDLGGLHEEIKKVREMIELPLKHPELFERLGIEPPRGILLHGPPGTGKTLLAKAVANESGAKFFVINGPEIMCVDGETKIFTNPKGYVKAKELFMKKAKSTKKEKNIEMIELEEPIATFAMDKNNQITKALITHVAKLQASAYRVSLSDGNEVITSHNQPFLVYEQGELVWKRVTDLKEGGYVARLNALDLPEENYRIPIEQLTNLDVSTKGSTFKSRNINRSNRVQLPKETSEEMLEFLGFLVSEGYIADDGITFANTNQILRARWKALLKNLFGITKTKEYKDGRVVTYAKTLISYLGLLGFTATNKIHIPPYFYQLPKRQIAAFIRGYFEGDGTVSKIGDYPTPILYSARREFLQDVQSVMQMKLDIPSILKPHNTPKGMMQKLVIRGNVGRKKFAAIGFISGKGRALQKIHDTKKPHTENIPVPELLIDQIRTKVPYKAYRNLDFYVYGSGGFTVHALQKLGEILKMNNFMSSEVQSEIELLLRKDVAWEKITKIEYVGERELFDFTVDKDNFVGAPYFFMHNSKFYGESEENLRKIFEEAEKSAPSIIFIDEIDAIAPKREEVRGDVEKRVVSQLLTLLDGLKDRGKIIVIGATNLPTDLDPALRRPGRFDREIELGVPNKEGRKEILQIHTRGMPLDKNVDLDHVAEITYGYVGADLNALCKEAAMQALRRVLPELNEIKEDKPIPVEILKKLIVTKEDFDHSLKLVGPSAMREVLIEVPKIKWDDIGGLENAKGLLRESVEWPLKNPDSFTRLGIRPPTGILLYGPPGTGKTLLAKAVANESGANFISVKGPELLSMWVGESERHVRDVFRRAKQVSPCIIFFDEIDALVPRRGMNRSDNVSERVVSQLLAEVSGLEDLHDVIVIAATNRPDIVDPALLRPGRFDRHILVPTPDEEARLQILKVHTRGMPLAKDVELEKLAKQTTGYSGADLSALCREAAIIALRKSMDAKIVTGAHFAKAMDEVGPSVNKEMNDFYKQVLQKKKKSRGIEEEISYTG
ncbi:MAG: AAA family ATPase [Candidatus Aenigmarchaeota archaeon]|nr:AAA family ATPase [Candidatus Aenigmarchaeota archaeon]